MILTYLLLFLGTTILNLAKVSANFQEYPINYCDDDIYEQLDKQNVQYAEYQQYIFILNFTDQIFFQLKDCIAQKQLTFVNQQSVNISLDFQNIRNSFSGNFPLVTVFNVTFAEFGNITIKDTLGYMVRLEIIQTLVISNLVMNKSSDFTINQVDKLVIDKFYIEKTIKTSKIVYSNILEARIYNLYANQIFGDFSLGCQVLLINNMTYTQYEKQQIESIQKSNQFVFNGNQIVGIDNLIINRISDVFYLKSQGTILIKKIKYSTNLFLQKDSNDRGKLFDYYFYIWAKKLTIYEIWFDRLNHYDYYLNLEYDQLNIRQLIVTNCDQYFLIMKGNSSFISEFYLNSSLQIFPGSMDNDLQLILSQQNFKIGNIYIGNEIPNESVSQSSLLNNKLYLQITLFNTLTINEFKNSKEEEFYLKVISINTFILNKIDLSYMQSGDYSKNQFFLQKIQEVHINNLDINLSQNVNFQLIRAYYIQNFYLQSASIKNIFVSNIYFIDLQQIENVFISDLHIYGSCFNWGIIYLNSIQNLEFSNSTIDIYPNESCKYLQKPQNLLETDLLKQKLFLQNDQQPSFVVIEPLFKESEEIIEFQFQFINITANFREANARFLDSRDNYKSLAIDNCIFKNMHILQNGGCIRLSNRFESFHFQSITNTVFENCFSQNFGGAIYSQSQIKIYNVTIVNSFAAFGGAYAGQIDENYSNNLIDYYKLNQLINVKSSYLSNRLLTLSTIKILKVLEYNSEIAEMPSIIQQYDYDNSTSIQIRPGINYILVLQVCLVSVENDTQNKTIECFDKQNQFDNMYYYINQTLTSNEDQEVKDSFLPININFMKDQAYLVFQPKSNKNYSSISLQLLQHFKLDLNFEITNCTLGQYYNYINPYQYQCQYCPDMFASYQTGLQKSCYQCDPKYFSKCYGNYSEINQNFYREFYTIKREEIYQCGQFNFCVGGSGIGNSLCSEGRVGVECSSCDIHAQYWNQSYSQSGYFACTKCQDISYNQVKIFLLLIGIIVFLFLVIYSNTSNIIKSITRSYLSKLGIVYLGRSYQNMGQSSVYIKIFSFNASMAYFIQQQLNINLKGLLLDQQMQFSDPLKTSAISLECAIKENYPNENSEIGFIKLLIYLSIPMIILPVVFTPYLFMLLRQKMGKKQFLYIIALSCIYILFISFYNPILSICLDALLCRTYGNNQKYSLLDLTQQCQQAKQHSHYAIAGIVIYSIILPTIIVIGLIRNKNRLNKISTLFTLGFLYRDYKEKYYYWELVRFSIKIIILLIQKVFLESIQFMNSLNIICLLSYMIPLIIIKPFAISNMNKLEVISVCIIILSFFALIIFTNEKNNNTQFLLESQILLYFSLICTLIFAVYLSICIIISLFETQILKLQKYSCAKKMCFKFYLFNMAAHQKRVRENLKKMRRVVKRIIGEEIPFMNSQKSFHNYELEDQNTFIQDESQVFETYSQKQIQII
ncbi:transmembrane protein, putative (macronuclear) [Tetrahymena thermophila SB210]|uniref:Transmembrane protein, putative n=1 Tax=Tetrahymena thermophila (strain SB210) TaxID=312017 RepID=Q234H7_TETTS|nr:transmembrane protein, putative [Tetrahymena thermophila SB210]EAR92026.2 transmembrane protein, putative [Tetrahymena thermophila SB210]|eukprot:XP_001012271.2 transmembrane protein, putative [Tetrahymena thermophila SB210]